MTTTEPAAGAAVEGFHSLFFEHLTAYSLVDYAYKTAHTYYTRVKHANKYLEYGLETAEYVTASATKTAEPLLSKVDAFSLKQLNWAEDTLSGSYETVTKLPYNLAERTLELGEDSLNYWLPVESAGEPKEHQEKQAEKEVERNFSHLSTRAYTILNSFQGRTKEKLYAYPVVSSTVDTAKAKLEDARALKQRVVALPSTVYLYYTEQKKALVTKLSSYYEYLTRPLFSVTDRAFELLQEGKKEYHNIRSSSFEQLGIRIANNVHSLTTYLYDTYFPSTFVNKLNQRLHELLNHLAELNPLKTSSKAKSKPPKHHQGESNGKTNGN